MQVAVEITVRRTLRPLPESGQALALETGQTVTMTDGERAELVPGEAFSTERDVAVHASMHWSREDGWYAREQAAQSEGELFWLTPKEDAEVTAKLVLAAKEEALQCAMDAAAP